MREFSVLTTAFTLKRAYTFDAYAGYEEFDRVVDGLVTQLNAMDAGTSTLHNRDGMLEVRLESDRNPRH